MGVYPGCPAGSPAIPRRQPWTRRRGSGPAVLHPDARAAGRLISYQVSFSDVPCHELHLGAQLSTNRGVIVPAGTGRGFSASDPRIPHPFRTPDACKSESLDDSFIARRAPPTVHRRCSLGYTSLFGATRSLNANDSRRQPPSWPGRTASGARRQVAGPIQYHRGVRRCPPHPSVNRHAGSGSRPDSRHKD